MEDSEISLEDDEYVPFIENSKKLTCCIKSSFACVDLGVLGAAFIEAYFYQSFLLEVANLNAMYTGFVLIIAQLADAVTAPLFGILSDSIKTCCGRKKFWILMATLPFSVSFLFCWQVFFEDQEIMFFYYGTMIFLFNGFGNMIVVPKNSLVVDLTSNYHERTEIVQVSTMLNFIWAIVAVFAHSTIITLFQSSAGLIDYQRGYTVSAMIFSFAFLYFPIISMLIIKEDPDRLDVSKNKKSNICKVIGSYLGVLVENSSFTILIFTCVLTSSVTTSIQTNLYLYIKYVIHREEEFKWFTVLIQVFAALSTILWMIISRKIGKKATFMIGIIGGAMMLGPVYFLNADSPNYVIYVLLVLAGIFVGNLTFLPYTMVPDLVEHDRQKNGFEREGNFYSLFILLQKFGRAGALALSSFSLDLAGYISPESETVEEQMQDYQPRLVISILRMWLSVIPAGLLCIAVIIFAFYRGKGKERN